MRNIIVFATLFSACSSLSVLRLSLLEGIEEKSNLFYRDGETPAITNLTDEDSVRCKNFTQKVVKDLDHEPSQDEVQTILSECRLLLQNSTLSARKHFNISKNSHSLDNSRLKYELIPESQASSEISEETNSIKTGSSNDSNAVLDTRQNENNSTNNKKTQKMEFDTGSPSPEIASWSFWSFLSPVKDTTDFSIGSPSFSFGNIKSYPILETGIHFGDRKNFIRVDTDIGKIWTVVMPGSKWCGAGNIAANDDDLGYYESLDKCCRAHDKCDDIIRPGQSKYNLTNTSSFTVLNCKCDDELHHCLSQIDSVTANAVGNIFFNLFSRRCYTLDYPKVCKKKHILFGCVEYEIDKTAEKIYQWKAAKKYEKLPFRISR